MLKGFSDKGFTLASVGDGTNRSDANAILVDPLFKEAKDNNKKSAVKLWQREWDQGASENEKRLKVALEKGKVPVFISVPGTSKKNQIPPTAAEFLAEKSGEKARFINGDRYFLSIHTSMMKSILKGERLFHPRVYEAHHNVFKAIQEAIPNAQFFIVEDLLTTGNSAHSFQRFLEKKGLTISGVIAMKGEYDLFIPPNLVKRIDEFFKANDIQVDAEKLCVEITGKEAQTLVFQMASEYRKADKSHQKLFKDLFETLYEIKVNDNHALLPKMDELGQQLSDYLKNSKKKKKTDERKEEQNEEHKKELDTFNTTQMSKHPLLERLEENSNRGSGQNDAERSAQNGNNATKEGVRSHADVAKSSGDCSKPKKSGTGIISPVVADKIKNGKGSK